MQQSQLIVQNPDFNFPNIGNCCPTKFIQDYYKWDGQSFKKTKFLFLDKEDYRIITGDYYSKYLETDLKKINYEFSGPLKFSIDYPLGWHIYEGLLLSGKTILINDHPIKVIEGTEGFPALIEIKILENTEWLIDSEKFNQYYIQKLEKFRKYYIKQEDIIIGGIKGYKFFDALEEMDMGEEIIILPYKNFFLEIILSKEGINTREQTQLVEQIFQSLKFKEE